MKPFIYSLEVWLTSVIVGAFLFYFIGHPTDDSSMTFWGYMIIVCLYTLLYSSISFLIFWSAMAWLTKRPLSRNRQRWIMTFIGLVLTVLPFPILLGRNHPDWLMVAEVAGCYSIPIAAGIWLFKFPI
jgi:hypothetical protein